ncbi:MAG: hypothetical protein ABEK36_05675, partial [Candidatus Aenigmatarchaeota archaeon]
KTSMDTEIIVFALYTPEKHVKKLENLTQNLKWNYVEINSKFKDWEGEYGKKKLQIIPDKDPHPAPHLHKLIAEELYKTIVKYKNFPGN